MPTVFDPLFCRLFRLDGIYINKDATKYSIKPITTMTVDKKGEVTTDQYMKYHEGIAHKFPGYQLDQNNIVLNVSDITINLQDHCRFLASKKLEDIDLYNKSLRS